MFRPYWTQRDGLEAENNAQHIDFTPTARHRTDSAFYHDRTIDAINIQPNHHSYIIDVVPSPSLAPITPELRPRHQPLKVAPSPHRRLGSGRRASTPLYQQRASPPISTTRRPKSMILSLVGSSQTAYLALQNLSDLIRWLFGLERHVVGS